ncbi:MAG: DUF4962 domain-containing protein [Chthoniobacteraceae bacterium]
MKPCCLLLLAALLTSVAHGEVVTSLQPWTQRDGLQLDPAKPGPSGSPAFKIAPGAHAVLKLRDQDGSGKVSFYVYDDTAVASPGKKTAVGPRWGTMEANGRILVGAIMYAPFLHAEGSVCLIDTNPGDPNAWRGMKFLAPRGQAGWKKWEIDYQPDQGLCVTVDGKPIPKRNFDWNNSQATGFNAIVLYGDSTPGDTAQTVWIADLSYELGAPMRVKPGDLPTPPPPLPVAKGPAPEEETDKSPQTAVTGSMNGFTPGPTLLDDVKNLRVPLVKDYAAQSPRLLFGAADRQALQQRAKERPDLWGAVLANADAIKNPANVPTPEAIRTGKRYWLIERAQSAALAWFLTRDPAYRDAAIRWMLAHCKEQTWGDTYRPNLDLVAAWYLYHIAIAYDILKSEMPEETRAAIRTGLKEHARYIYLEHDPLNTATKVNWDQNHTYIPIVGLSAAALALLDEEPEAKYWLTRSYAVLRRSRAVLNEDGYYYEGVGYWAYALNWHVRGAELLSRATGENLFNLPALRDNWLFGLHLSLPGTPRAFGVGDTLSWKDSKLTPIAFNGTSMFWAIAAQTGSAESQAAAEWYAARGIEPDYPATNFLWFNSAVKPAPVDKLAPYHYFADQDVITWRSGWDADATSYHFRCGPPLGHRAADKLKTLTDWAVNCGHVHPDIGAFLLSAHGSYLAVDTAYTAEKYTRDHNTLLIDGKGQGMDGSYWNDKGIPYGQLDAARITSQFLSPAYGYAKGTFGKAYTRLAPGAELTRALLMTKEWLLIVDDLAADRPRNLTWLCHSVGEFQPEGSAYLSRQEKATLAVVPLAPASLEAKTEPTIVQAGRGPGKATPEQRGYTLALATREASAKTRFVTLLFPLAATEKVPEATLVKNEGDTLALRIKKPDGKTETVSLDLSWEPTKNPEPATIRRE